ncbi:mannose-1-phosphate guanyltransferase [Strigomonas culicis]|uniref:Mannose-1-phosphate guanyltransferase n=1 Tax=Strigomonas culicis TaxID=28005 RepID=S9VTL2_9TRYP|nr:mannose-1-phosphate guanyltransferase [Strigomonas culicis]|eukprot:EPY30496.1 mannose-1-phosphate guanyltransferase [Strigomonas culicis]
MWHQGPIVLFHPMMLLEMRDAFPTVEFAKMAEFSMRQLGPILQLGPIDTLGPITQPSPMWAVGSTMQQPMIVKAAPFSDSFSSVNRSSVSFLVPRIEVRYLAIPPDEVRRLANIHPEALEVVRVQLSGAGHLREDLLLDRRATRGNAVQHALVEDVNTGVDAVTDKALRLLYELVNAVRHLVVNDHAVLVPFGHLGDHNGALLAMVAMEREQLAKRKAARDIGVQHEEGLVVLHQHVARERKRASRAQRLRLEREHEVHAELLAPLIHLRLHGIRAVRHGQDDFRHASLLQRLHLVDNDGLVAEGNKRLGHRERQRAQARAIAANKNESPHARAGPLRRSVSVIRHD